MTIVCYPPARSTDPSTSKEAARRLRRRHRFQRMVLQVFAQHGSHGATNEDVYAGWPREREDALRPRVAELRYAGFITSFGTKMGSRGRHIKVWRITDAGKAWLKKFE